MTYQSERQNLRVYFRRPLDLLNFLFSGDAISEERNETTAKHNKNTIQPAATAKLDINVSVIGIVLPCNWLAFLRILHGNWKTDYNIKGK